MKRHRASRQKQAENAAGPPLSPLPPQTQTLTGAWRFALPLLLSCYIALALAHAWLAPIGKTGYQNAPDEAAHVTYVRMVAKGRLPSKEMPALPAQAGQPSYEWHQPPLYYFIAARFLPLGERGVRLASILLGACSIYFIFRSARLLLPHNPRTAILATGVAALIPGHIAITSVVNNDCLLELCFSAVLMLTLECLMNGFTLTRAAWIGVALGAALLTKSTAILLLPLVAFALILIGLNGEPRKAILQGAMIIALLAVCLSGWWFARNGVLYHEWLPVRAFQQSFGGTVNAQDIIAGKAGLRVDGWLGYFGIVGEWTFKSFWAVYGTQQSAVYGVPRFLPDQLYALAGLIVGVVIAGMTRLHLRRHTEFSQAQIYGLWLLFAALGLVGVAFAGFILRYFQAQGRYFYPAMLPICLIVSLGWRAVFPARYADAASVFLMALLAVFSVAFLRYVM